MKLEMIEYIRNQNYFGIIVLKQAVHSNATLYGKNSFYIPIFYNLVEDGRYIIMIIECLKSASNTRFSTGAQFGLKIIS